MGDKKKPTIYYMHTRDGKPAVVSGKYMCYSDQISTSEMCTSLREVRERQEMTQAWRAKSDLPPLDLSYIRVVVTL